LPAGIFSRVLNDRTKEITKKNAERMASALKVSLSWLLTGKEAGAEEPASKLPARSLEDARRLAIEWARWEGMDERAIRMVMAMPLVPYRPRIWLSLIEVCAANLALGRDEPQPPPSSASGA